MKYRNAVRLPTGATSIPKDVYEELQLWAIETLNNVDELAVIPKVGIRHTGDFTAAYIEFEVKDAD